MNRDIEARDFLLRSLDDLEQEHAAGDLSDSDFAALKADYTRQAAEAIRRIEGHGKRSSVRGARAPSWSRTAAWVGAIVVVSVVAGVLLAQFSGSRGSGDTITGDIRTSTREMLAEAQQTFGSGDLDGAIALYDDVLELQPANTEALAYKGWFLRLSGDADQARPLVEDAVAIDPDYPDARVFAASIALELGDIDAAAGHLDAFEALDAPPFIDQLVSEQGLRERIRLAQNAPTLALVQDAWPEQRAPFNDTGLTTATVLAAAEELAVLGGVFDAVVMLEAVLDARPDDVAVLAGTGWILARSATPEQPDSAEVARSYLDRALEIEPQDAEALVYRAFVHAFLGDQQAGTVDLQAYEQLAERVPDLDELIDEFDLRGQLS